MNQETLLDMQKYLSKIYNYIFAFSVAFILLYSDASFTYLIPILSCLVIMFFVDNFLAYKRFYDKLIILVYLRYIQFFLSTLFFLFSHNIYLVSISLLAVFWFCLEYTIVFCFINIDSHVIPMITVAFPFFLGSLLQYQYNLNNKISFIFILGFNILIVLFLLNIVHGISYAMIYYNKKILAQNRFIEHMNDSNEALKLSETNLKRSNELLGIQKIQLEVANKKISNVNSEMMIQNEIVKYISTSLDINLLMELITESIVEGMGVDLCCLILKESYTDNKTIKFKLYSRLNKIGIEQFKNAISYPSFFPYLQLTDIYVDNEVGEKQYDFFNNNEMGSFLMVPFIKNKKQIGLLFTAHKTNNYFIENVSFFESIAAQFLIALDNANMYTKMKNMAIKDTLTGIFNRGYLTKKLNKYLEEMVENETVVTIALFDIDKFKKVNDCYGHAVGDFVIQTIANLASDIAEEEDAFIGRYGGEEFVMIYYNKNIEQVYPSVCKLRQTVCETEIVYNDISLFVSISIGLASYPETCSMPEKLLHYADLAMYYVKQTGRNQIAIDSEKLRSAVKIKKLS